MNMLALDLGTNVGWAYSDGRSIYSGCHKIKSSRFNGCGYHFLQFKIWLENNLLPKTDIVYYEEVRRHIGTDAAHKYGGFLAVLTSLCELHNIPYHGIPVGTIKKHATGKGNASKQEIITAMAAKGHITENDNEADALAVLYCAIGEIND